MRRIIILLIFLAYGTGINAQTLLLNTPLLKSHQTAEVKEILAIMTEAFNTLDIKVEYRYRPDKRSITEANAGTVDGEFARIATIVDQYPNLVIVPEPLANSNLVAFSLQPDIKLSDYKIEQHQYRIAYLSGWANATALLKDYENKVAVAAFDVLFKLLASKRVDVVIYN